MNKQHKTKKTEFVGEAVALSKEIQLLEAELKELEIVIRDSTNIRVVSSSWDRKVNILIKIKELKEVE